MTTAHETSTGFSEQVLREHAYFEMNKQHEMKDMLQQYADGQVEMLKRAMDDWDRVSQNTTWPAWRGICRGVRRTDNVDHSGSRTNQGGCLIRYIFGGRLVCISKVSFVCPLC